METFPFWDPFGWFWILGWYLLWPFMLVGFGIWCLLDWALPRGPGWRGAIRYKLDWVLNS